MPVERERVLRLTGIVFRESTHMVATYSRRYVRIVLCTLFAGAGLAAGATLRLNRTIPLSGVDGRIDHFAVDVGGKRLFVCALGNNSLEIIDLEKGERVHSITGLGTPQGVGYASAADRLYVANDKAGFCNIYDGQSFAPVGQIDLKDDADNVRYDETSRRIFVGYGDGGIAIIEGDTGKNSASIKLSAHPEAFVVEKDGSRIFVNVPNASHIAVVDRAQAKVIATWKLDGVSGNFPIALDEGNHRLFVGCRSPGTLVVLDAQSGTVVTRLAISSDADDIFYDHTHHCLYVVCGEGTVDVIDQVDRNTYKVTKKTETSPGARTGLFVPELNSLFVAVPRRGSQSAEVRQFAID